MRLTLSSFLSLRLGLWSRATDSGRIQTLLEPQAKRNALQAKGLDRNLMICGTFVGFLF